MCSEVVAPGGKGTRRSGGGTGVALTMQLRGLGSCDSEERGCRDGGRSSTIAQMMVVVAEAIDGLERSGSCEGVLMEGEEGDKAEVV